MPTDWAGHTDQSSDKPLDGEKQTDLPRPLPANPEGHDDNDVFGWRLNDTKPTPERAGAGGGWETINEQVGGAVAQITEKSCVAACGEMLSEGRIKQADLINEIGTPAHANMLANKLGDEWKAGLAPNESGFVGIVADQAPCGVELYEGGRMSHMVVLDGMSDSGNVLIRDPWNGGSTYEMSVDNFFQAWNGVVVSK